MRPIRSIRRREFVRNPWGDGSAVTQQRTEMHALTDGGCIRSVLDTHRTPCGCGCLSVAAGVCSACGSTACAGCFSRCAAPACRRPLCPRHGIVVACAGHRVVMCEPCHAAMSRRSIARSLARVMLSPFVEFNSRESC